MKSNQEVVVAFLNRKFARSGSMMSTGNRLYSYNTIIAQWSVVFPVHMTVNDTKYSRTTSKQQSLLAREIVKFPAEMVISHTDKIHLNAQSL